MVRYTTEVGDVLLSVQGVLLNEAHPLSPEAPTMFPIAGARRLAVVRDPSAPDGPSAPDARATRAAERDGTPTPRPPAPESVPSLRLIDATGAGTLRALRRDLATEREYPSEDREGLALAAIDVRSITSAVAAVEVPPTEELLRAIVEAVPVVLRSTDRVYRFDDERLVLMLPGSDAVGAEVAIARLEAHLIRVLAARGFVGFRLGARTMDPAEVALAPDVALAR